MLATQLSEHRYYREAKSLRSCAEFGRIPVAKDNYYLNPWQKRQECRKTTWKGGISLESIKRNLREGDWDDGQRWKLGYGK